MPVQFPSRDFTNQYISMSYQDVVQRYNTPPTEYLLDGLGYVILSIPSASLGNGVITTDQTASYSYQSISSSYAVSSSISDVALVADVAFLADTASIAALADFATSASWASQSLSASWANPLVTGSTVPITASWALNAINGGTQLVTGSTYPITSSWSVNASTASGVNIVSTNANNNLYPTLVSGSGIQQIYIDPPDFYYNPSTNTLFVNTISASVVSASLYGTASNATTASYITASGIEGVVTSASYAQTASVSIFIFSNITQSFVISASWASSSYQSQFATQSLFSNQSTNATNSLFAISASWASSSIFSNQSTNATNSLFSISASWASSSISAAYAPVDPVYSASVSSEFGTKQDTLVVGGTYPITASWAQTSSWAQNAVTASFALTSSYLIYPSVTLTAFSSSTTKLISISNNIYNSIFVTYFLNDTQNFRAGNVVVLYNTQSTVMTETSTTDLGDSSGLTLSASLSASSVNLLAINATANNYTVKYHFDVL